MKRKFQIRKGRDYWCIIHPLGGIILCKTFSEAVLGWPRYASQLHLEENERALPRTQDNQNPNV